MKNKKTIEWVLRIAVAGEFLGHGIFALRGKEDWIHYFTAIGISTEAAVVLLPLIGLMDVTLAILILIKPYRLALLWMAAWGLSTALIRPLTGGSIWDFVERFANWGAPLALYFVIKETNPFIKIWKKFKK
ncbi:hypothetical protein CL634_03965 [bacterium]|nr:hypothetical protein [bacterium]|tara:strand:- start:2077 stop:2469 length:393 start_codon:yes stop_codon:yes gene_type:complete